MKTWLDKLIEPLEHPKYPQIKGKLVKMDYSGQIIGKCAEGEIACQNEIKVEPGRFYLSNDNLLDLGIPEDLTLTVLPYLWTTNQYPWSVGFDIGDYIVSLNDHGYTYQEIVEFLRITFEDAV